MKHEVTSQWMGKMQFNSLVNDHVIIMDAPERVGGENLGTIPKPLVLTALSGCTGMDVVALLRKEGKELRNFNVVVSGELTKSAPMQYSAIHVVYEAEGDDAMQTDVLRVVNRSQEDICGVSAMLKKAMPVTWEVWFNKIKVFDNLHIMELNPAI
ncbi:MAG: OsmC family protein [Chitinophagaceae bacterium]|nr:OsmC family protein [Chitinophagaceae bacterium]